uniref:Bm13370 n=1 Tax=Brugia malayi TaxID=6279 RepID=A0A1I9G026_BRUMA|nr:Bm13370 [Brugia malayi]
MRLTQIYSVLVIQLICHLIFILPHPPVSASVPYNVHLSRSDESLPCVLLFPQTAVANYSALKWEVNEKTKRNELFLLICFPFRANHLNII